MWVIRQWIRCRFQPLSKYAFEPIQCVFCALGESCSDAEFTRASGRRSGNVAADRAGAAPALPVVGFLRSEPLTIQSDLVSEFRAGLKDAGYVEGENVTVEYQSADGQVAKLPGLVADMIRRPVAVIVGNIAPAQAAKSATTTVPIVFVVGDDPVALGLVPSLNRPGGNVTGLFFLSAVVSSKRMELLRELVPQNKAIGVVVDPATNGERERTDIQAAAGGDKILSSSTQAPMRPSMPPLKPLPNAASARSWSDRALSR